jgi:chromosome segregation ATPase
VYETERNSVIEVLDKNGIDTTSLLPLDTSVSDDVSTYSLMEQDLGGAVAKLATKSSSDSLAVSRKLHDVETELERVMLELEEMKSMKNVLEKRVEMMKTSAKTSRDEYAKANEEIDLLSARVEELTADLTQARQKVVNSADVVHSEVQALEEENIEIMKENKELRKELSKLKLQAEKASLVSTKAPVTIADTSSQPIVQTAVDHDLKRKRSLDDEAVIAAVEARENMNNGINLTTGLEGDGSLKGRRVRSKVVSKQAVDAPSNAVEAPGECNQS